jgi:hypothetical protein
VEVPSFGDFHVSITLPIAGQILVAKFFRPHGFRVQRCDRVPGDVDAQVTVVDGQQADALAGHHLGEKHFVHVEAELTVLEHAPHIHDGVVLGLGHAAAKQARRVAINRIRRLHGQRLVRAQLVVFSPELVEGLLPHAAVGYERQRSGLFQCAVHAFVPSVRFRIPGGDAPGTMPSLIHQTDSRDSPATAHEAKGGPLSERTAEGMPYLRNAASKMACTRSVSVFSTAWQRSR